MPKQLAQDIKLAYGRDQCHEKNPKQRDNHHCHVPRYLGLVPKPGD
jgi:hypothetical protein